MSHTTFNKNRDYDNSKMKAFHQLMAQPALNHHDPKYQILLNDLQAGILKHQNRNHTVYLFLRFKDLNGGRKWISNFTNSITSAKEQLNGQPDQIITLSLTNMAYDFLDLPDSIKPDDQAFRGDINKRLQFGENRINNDFSQPQNIHAIVMIASNEELTKKTLEDVVVLKQDLINNILNDRENVLDILFEQIGAKENVPFGKSIFKDGFSNPKFFPCATSSGSGKAIKTTDLPSLSQGIILDKGGNSNAPCGSLGTFARFEFNQTAINKLTGQIKKQTADSYEDDFAEAVLLGRFHDGTSLSLSDKPTNKINDDFNYHEMIKATDKDQLQNDTDASRCPFFAHARKANPRTKGSQQKKILRRGVYYNESNTKQGLLFITYQNSIENQFEYIVKNWMMNPLIQTDQKYLMSDFKAYDAPKDYAETSKEEVYQNIYKRSGVDILFAPKGTIYEIPKEWNQSNSEKVSIEIERQLVDFEGGVYFFTPSISFLKKIELFPVYDNHSGKVSHTQQTGIIDHAFDLPQEQISKKAAFRSGTIMHLNNDPTITSTKIAGQETNIPYIQRNKQNFEYQLKKETVSEESEKT